jgi:hypothetical protein
VDSTATLPRTASLVSRNLVPVAGVLLLGWSAPDLLVVYYLDTVLGFAVVVLLVARHVTGLGAPNERGRPLDGPLDWARGVAGALLGAALIGLPLGVPLFIMLAQFDWSVADALADRTFVTALALQAAGSAYGCVQAHRDLLARSDDEHVLKHRAAFVVGRWMVVLVAAMTGLTALFGPRFGGALVVLAYAGATVYFELYPRRALEWLNPREAQDAPVPPQRTGKRRRGSARRLRSGTGEASPDRAQDVLARDHADQLLVVDHDEAPVRRVAQEHPGDVVHVHRRGHGRELGGHEVADRPSGPLAAAAFGEQPQAAVLGEHPDDATALVDHRGVGDALVDQSPHGRQDVVVAGQRVRVAVHVRADGRLRLGLHEGILLRVAPLVSPSFGKTPACRPNRSSPVTCRLR